MKTKVRLRIDLFERDKFYDNRVRVKEGVIGYIDGYIRYDGWAHAVVVFKNRIEFIQPGNLEPIGIMNEAEIKAFFTSPIDTKDE